MLIQIALGFEPSKAMATEIRHVCTSVRLETLTCNKTQTVLAKFVPVLETIGGVTANVKVADTVVCCLVPEKIRNFGTRIFNRHQHLLGSR
jgi:hypothetical protein